MLEHYGNFGSPPNSTQHQQQSVSTIWSQVLRTISDPCMATRADDAGRCIVPADYLRCCMAPKPGLRRLRSRKGEIVRFTHRAHPSQQLSLIHI